MGTETIHDIVVETSYHQGNAFRGIPMINVKWHPWMRDVIAKYRNDDHEFSGDEPFWSWVEQIAHEYDHEGLELADQLARDCGWNYAQEEATEHFGPRAKVYSEGRSGGWLVVHGLGSAHDWDYEDAKAWDEYRTCVRDIVANLDYDFVWHLYVNYWEPQVLQPQIEKAQQLAALYLPWNTKH